MSLKHSKSFLFMLYLSVYVFKTLLMDYRPRTTGFNKKVHRRDRANDLFLSLCCY